MTKDLLVMSLIATIVEDPDTTPMSVRLPTKEEKILLKEEVEEKNHHQGREGVGMIDMHEGTDSVKESKLDVLQSQHDKFKMKDGEGVAEMYSRLALITNEIAGLGSEEMTDRFIIKKILRALDGKYDRVHIDPNDAQLQRSQANRSHWKNCCS